MSAPFFSVIRPTRNRVAVLWAAPEPHRAAAHESFYASVLVGLARHALRRVAGSALIINLLPAYSSLFLDSSEIE